MTKRILFLLLGALCAGMLVLVPGMPAHAQESDTAPSVYMFGRDNCGFCKKQRAFLDSEGIAYEYLNVVEDEEASRLFNAVAEKYGLMKVTPLTVIGATVIQGFDSENTTGIRIRQVIEAARDSDILSVEDNLDRAEVQSIEQGSGCDESGSECDASAGGGEYVFDIPLMGQVDVRVFSLATLSILLGTIDGFNPCAMWVLITFLVLLSQAGSKRKMIFLAGLFIVAEATMYNLILNVWYKTWDFVSLDQFVVPLVGLLALGGGAFFLYRWYKNRNMALVCDISSLESQSKTIGRFKAIINQPFTILTVLTIIVIAFSVNVIEFACSIGIPQAYTKILELNALGFFERQMYLLVYTIGYMLDDVIVFSLAIWGYSRLEAHGHKYAQISLLVGGILMLLLGALLITSPTVLVW